MGTKPARRRVACRRDRFSLYTATDSGKPGGCATQTMAGQLFAKKSIDKLISDSENPEHRLKKTLGPWSLTALGIGAVIGSGIFTVVGTAIAGQKFDTSSIFNAPLLDYLIHHAATTGRPGAGPALALSWSLWQLSVRSPGCATPSWPP